tara:strand:+ start:7547 stop:9256 length:1710 start_codon:yes stop_codon:yes gene_type:complete
MKLMITMTLLLYFSTAQVSDGYVIFTPQQGGGGGGGSSATTYLMDTDYNAVHTWSHDRGPASMPYLLPDSSIIYPYRVPFPTMTNGGVGGGIRGITWDSTILWDYTVSDDIYQHHHDVEPLPNGNVLIIAWERKSASEAYAMGRQVIDNPLNEMWSEAILELNPETGEFDWEWHHWDHLIQDISSSYPNYGVISEHPELFNINEGNVGGGGGGGGGGQPNADWMHFNAIHYNEDLDQIVVSSPSRNEILVIDHSTTTEEAASHSGGNSGLGGDFIYRWGNPQNYDRGNSSNHLLQGQHGVNWIPEGYPGEGNFILFNNRETDNSSSVIEFTPPLNPDGSYAISDGQPYGPEEPVWMYSSGASLQSNVQSGAFRQSNGNTLITEADDAQIIEVDTDGNIVWNYTYSGNENMIARAQKYHPDYLEQGNESSVVIEHQEFWNLVGLPVTVDDSSVNTIFPDAISGTLYEYNNAYISADELTPGNGYWLRFSSSGTNTVTGESINSIDVSLVEGWNLITGPSYTAIIDDPGGIVIDGTLYGYNSAYFNVNELEPGSGYWVRANASGEVTLMAR